MPKHDWRAISIGYEMRNPPTPDLATAIAAGAAAAGGLREKLDRDFDAGCRKKWKDGHSTDLAFACSGDTWVAKVLETELNQGLRKGLRPFSISERDLLLLRPRSWQGSAAPATSDWPGTSCKLFEGRWVNSRAYEIDAPTEDWGDPQNVLLIATLMWPCPGCDADAAAAAGVHRNGGSKSG
jgi:hypothetical protein